MLVENSAFFYYLFLFAGGGGIFSYYYSFGIFYNGLLQAFLFVRVIGIILWWVGLRTGFPCSLTY